MYIQVTTIAALRTIIPSGALPRFPPSVVRIPDHISDSSFAREKSIVRNKRGLHAGIGISPPPPPHPLPRHVQNSAIGLAAQFILALLKQSNLRDPSVIMRLFYLSLGRVCIDVHSPETERVHYVK